MSGEDTAKKLTFAFKNLKGEAGLSPKLLWTNPAPEAGFGIKDVPFEASSGADKYSFFAIVCANLKAPLNKTPTFTSIVHMPATESTVNAIVTCPVDPLRRSPYPSGRTLTLSRVSNQSFTFVMSFTQASVWTSGSVSTIDDNYCIPIHIYGLA